jgi:acyl-CoA thioesterase FadM
MNLYFRLVLTIIRALLSKRIRCDENTVSKWRVLPNDIDAYGHMNNGRYLTLISLAAIEAVIRTGLLKSSLKRGYLFIWDQSQVRWQRPLKLFEKFTIEVQMLYCEGKYLYATGIFVKTNGKIAAEIHYRCCLKSRKGEDLDAREILAMDGLTLPHFSGPSPLPKELFVSATRPTQLSAIHPVPSDSTERHPSTDAFRNERRHHPRKRVHFPTIINGSIINGAPYHPGIIQDISLDGLCVCIPKDVSNGINFHDKAHFDIVFALPEETSPFSGQCRPHHLIDKKNEILIGATFLDEDGKRNPLLQKYLS